MGQLLAKFKIWREKNQSWHETTVQGIIFSFIDPFTVRTRTILSNMFIPLASCNLKRYLCVAKIQFYNINCRVRTLRGKRCFSTFIISSSSFRVFSPCLNFDIAPEKT